ncbi:MAG: transcription termination factor Rho, partial [Epsilonproteobacteria bacterium]|nr:transcription termination factor Rho [Campylobacterota bacterium]
MTEEQSEQIERSEVEEQHTEQKQSKQPKQNNQKTKNRTHIPVTGLTIDDLRAKPTDELILIAKDLEIENPQE